MLKIRKNKNYGVGEWVANAADIVCSKADAFIA